MLDVLIVGAGPTGLTLAIDLSRRGLAVRIIDKSAGPQEGSRGFGVKPRTLEIFDDLGVAGDFLAADHYTGRTKVHMGGALLADFRIKSRAPTPERPYPNYVSLPEWKTEEILRGRLAQSGVTVEFGVALTSFVDEGDSVTVQLSDGSQATASYLVGCDGGRSTVRKQLGLAFEGSTTDARALLADVDVSGLEDEDAVHIWAGDGAMIVLRPYAPGQPWQVIASIGADEEPSLELLQRFARERTGLSTLELSNLRWLSVWRYSLRIVDRYRVGRVFIAGDAAHIHSPFGAFGMNTGIQDAYNLGWKLAYVLQGKASEELLDTYETERLPVGRAILDESDRRFAAATAPPRVLRPLLRFLIKPFLVRLNERGRTDHPSYYESPLTLPSVKPRFRRTALRAGDSAPRGVDAGPEFTVVAFDREVPAGLEQFGDQVTTIVASDNLRQTWGVAQGTLALIRPDGYLAALTTEADELVTQLANLLARRELSRR
ncbi:FAD-dependent oxidoreductase [Kribbella sp. NPDC023855]|uniref:FAD-dependent oxidoreductase n=1 Tax=Kribbella sp. NPDC023855 TaxID=3154698 RepID=UPI0033CD740C